MKIKYSISHSILIQAFAVFIVLTSSGYRASAQNLQFSRVIYLSTNDTVDAGKVWKIERILNANPNNPIPVYINGSNVGFVNQGSYGLSANAGGINSSFSGPIWLPAGTVISNNPDLRFSIIEFSIVP